MAPQSATTDNEQLVDPTPYGNGPDASVTDVTEQAAVSHHVASVAGKTIPYTDCAGHLVTVEPTTALPNAKFFYVAFTMDGVDPTSRPVTFF